jgi:hypothetical protein
LAARSDTGTKLLISSGLASNLGSITLVGGTFDNGGLPLVNSGQISGYGTLAAGSITNAANSGITIAGGSGIINGPLVNAANATVRVSYSAAVFTGAVTNNGTFLIQSGSATFVGAFVNNGIYSSDPSTNSFNDLNTGSTGALVAGSGDQFTLTGNFHSISVLASQWNTLGATLEFSAGGSSSTHALDVTGIAGDGYTGNYAWGTLELDSGQSVLLDDAEETAGGALYVSTLDLAGAPSGTSLASFIASHLQNTDPLDTVNVYYDSTQPGNEYLGDASYALGDGGVLAPADSATPEPVNLSLLFLAAAGLGCRRRRNRRPAAGR